MNQLSSEMKQALTRVSPWLHLTKYPGSRKRGGKYEFLDIDSWSRNGKTFDCWNESTGCMEPKHFTREEILEYFYKEIRLYSKKNYDHDHLVTNTQSMRGKHFTGSQAKSKAKKVLQPQVPPLVPETMAPPAREKVSTNLHEELQKSQQRLATAQQEVKVWEQAIRIAEGA